MGARWIKARRAEVPVHVFSQQWSYMLYMLLGTRCLHCGSGGLDNVTHNTTS